MLELSATTPSLYLVSELDTALLAAGCDLSNEVASGQVEQYELVAWVPLVRIVAVNRKFHLRVQGELLHLLQLRETCILTFLAHRPWGTRYQSYAQA